MQYSRRAPSQDYLKLLAWAKDFHQRNKAFTGRRLLQSYTPLKRLVDLHQVRTILDYGAGKGAQYTIRDFSVPGIGVVPSLEEGLGVTFTPYDPAWPAYEKLPDGPFDATVATDVLEYVPEVDIDWVLDEMFSRARKLVFVHSSTVMSTKKRPADMERPDRSLKWWLRSMQRAGMRHPGIDWVAEIRVDRLPPQAWRRYGESFRLEEWINREFVASVPAG